MFVKHYTPYIHWAPCCQEYLDDFWPNDLKINRGHLLVTLSLHVKFEGHGCSQCQVITQTSFLCSLTLDPMTITSIYGVIYWSTPSSMSNLRAMLCRQCRVITRKSFSGSRSVTLTFDPMTLKSIGVIYWSPPASMSSLRAMDAGNVELWLRQAFQVHGHCNLDLWPNDLKINRGHLLVWPSLHIKFKDHGCRQCQVITRTSFSGSRSLWPWPLTWKSIGVIYWSLPASMSSLRAMGEGNVELSLGQDFRVQGRWLRPWPLKWWPQNQWGSSTGHPQPPSKVWGL